MVSVPCKPDDTVQCFKYKLAAMAETQKVCLAPWRPDDTDWGLTFRAHHLVIDTRTLHDYGVDQECLPKVAARTLRFQAHPPCASGNAFSKLHCANSAISRQALSIAAAGSGNQEGTMRGDVSR